MKHTMVTHPSMKACLKQNQYQPSRRNTTLKITHSCLTSFALSRIRMTTEPFLKEDQNLRRCMMCSLMSETTNASTGKHCAILSNLVTCKVSRIRWYNPQRPRLKSWNNKFKWCNSFSCLSFKKSVKINSIN